MTIGAKVCFDGRLELVARLEAHPDIVGYSN